MKKYLILIFVLLLALATVTSCKGENNGNNSDDEMNYPEGAIALTKENFTDYFDIKTTATCDYNYYIESTEAVAYVAFVPKQDYKDAVGSVTFDVDTRVYKWYGNENFKISNSEEHILLNSDIPNGSYRLTIQGSSNSSTDPYKIKTNTIGITVNSVEGYVLVDEREKEKDELSSLTDEERNSSRSVYSELSSLINNFKSDFSTADSYNYIRNANYMFTSIYGNAMSKSGSTLGYSYKIDKANNRFETPQGKFYSINDSWYEQSIWSGLVRTSETGNDMAMAQEGSTPVWDVLDQSAVYVKESECKYTAYVSLKDMKDGVWRKNIISELNQYGLTTKHDKFVVKYHYDFTDGFNFYVSIRYEDVRYHVDYCAVAYDAEQRITALNNSTVDLYDAKSHKFMLADNFEDAVLFKNGLVEIDGDTAEISYTTYSTQYEGVKYPSYENYLPLRILEGGVYNLLSDEQSVEILDENGRKYGYYDTDNYYPAGLYYLEIKYVPYGKTDVKLTVESRIYEDYADLYAPDHIWDVGDSFALEFEGNGDKCAVAFTPEYDGIYSFGYHDNVSIYYYDKNDLNSPVTETWQPLHNVELVGGTEYVLALECVNYGDSTERFTFTSEVKYIGEITPNGTVIDNDWNSVLAFDETEFVITVPTLGYYYVEYERDDGKDVQGGSFYTEDGKWYYQYKTVTVGDKEIKAYVLEPGKTYTYMPGLNMHEYFKGRLRLVCYEEGVTENSEITVTDDGYITITTSNLNTLYSSSSFTFTVTENCRLLITVDSDFFALYDESGRRYGTVTYPTYDDAEFGIETNYIKDLKPGTYTIVFSIDSEYATLGVKTASVRIEIEKN